MAKQTMISVTMDKKLKEAAQKTAGDLGLPLGTLINAFLRQFVRDKSVTLSVPLTPTKYLQDIIARSDAEYRTGKVKKFASMDEMFAELDK
jgi:addiction module RelB/DinJ family antitoxin